MNFLKEDSPPFLQKEPLQTARWQSTRPALPLSQELSGACPAKPTGRGAPVHLSRAKESNPWDQEAGRPALEPERALPVAH